MIDDMGWKDLDCTGSEYYRTPHIDGLAAQGIRFENAYPCAPVCSPSRGAILSGKFPGRTAFTNVFGQNLTISNLCYKTPTSAAAPLKSNFLSVIGLPAWLRVGRAGVFLTPI
ncbi:MAG: sulfatase-like hydrolase/transferase [Verrucomicrobia bacterium]|nr:sulfatase-like hydrolase/transferase [Verrucomicrobiota bacterium]